MKCFKTRLICILLAALIICLNYTIMPRVKAPHLPKGMINSNELGMASGGEREIRAFSDASYVSLAKNNRLYYLENGKVQKIDSDVTRYALLSKGVAYIDSLGDVSIFSNNKVTTVASGVHSICSDKKDLFLYSEQDRGVFIYSNGVSELMFTLPGHFGRVSLMATNSWIVACSSSEEVYYFDRYNKNCERLSNASDIYNGDLFIYKDYLFHIGYCKSGGEVYNLKTGDCQPIDFGWDGTEHTTRISVAADDNDIYISVRSKLWPQLGHEEYERTFWLNTTTMDAVIIDEKFYENLLLTTTALYGGDLWGIEIVEVKGEAQKHTK